MAEPLKVAADYRVPFICDMKQETIWSNVSIPFDSDGITDEQRSSWGFPTALSSYPATDFYLSSASELPKILVMAPPSAIIHFDNAHEYNISLSIQMPSDNPVIIGYSNDNKIAILIGIDSDSSSEGMVADYIDILVSNSLLEEIGYTSGDNITLQLNGLTGQIYYYYFGESSTPKIITPPTPIIPGKKITGWYTDPEYTTLFDFETTPVDPTSGTVYYGKTIDMNPSYGITHLQINYNDYLYHQLDGRYIEHKGYTLQGESITSSLQFDEDGTMPESQAVELGIQGFDSYPLYMIEAGNLEAGIITNPITVNLNINNIDYSLTCTPIEMGSYEPPLDNVLVYSADHKIAILAVYINRGSTGITMFNMLTNYDINTVGLPTGSITYTKDTIVPFDRKFIPAATRNEIGGIKVGNNLSIDSDGTLNASSSEVKIDNTTIFKGFQDRLQAIGKKGTGTNAEIFNYWQDESGSSYNNNVAAGNYSHAEGRQTAAIGYASHVEGNGYVYSIKISGSGTTYSYDTDSFTPISGDLVECYHSNNYTTILTVDNQNHTFTTLSSISDIEISNVYVFCFQSYTLGSGSHAEGYCTKAIGDFSHAGGEKTIAGYSDQTVIGKYNDNKSNTLFEIGNGYSNNRSNAFEVRSDGSVWTQGNIYIGNSNKQVLAGAASSSNLGGVKINYDSSTQTLYMTTE